MAPETRRQTCEQTAYQGHGGDDSPASFGEETPNAAKAEGRHDVGPEQGPNEAIAIVVHRSNNYHWEQRCRRDLADPL